MRGAEVVAPYQAYRLDAIAEGVVGVLCSRLIVGNGGGKATEGVVGVDCCKNSSLEAAALAADRLSEQVFIALGEARRIRSLALHGLCPARAVGEDAVGVKLGGDGGAGDGECIAIGGAGCDASRYVGVMDGHSSPVLAILRCSGVAKLVDAGDDAAKLVVSYAGNREPDLSRKVGLPSRSLAAEGVVAVAGREPRDVGHVERDKTRSGGYAPFIVVVPSSSRTVGLNLRNLMAAVPRRGRDLPGEVLERHALACRVICHAVSGNSIPKTVDECLGARFRNFTAASALLRSSVSPFRSTALTRTSAGDAATGTSGRGAACWRSRIATITTATISSEAPHAIAIIRLFIVLFAISHHISSSVCYISYPIAYCISQSTICNYTVL